MSVQAEYTTEEIIAPEFDDEIHYGEDLFDRTSKAAEAATIPAPDDFDEQVENAQRQLNALRHQQEMIERQKQELETLSQKQAEFAKGKRDICEKEPEEGGRILVKVAKWRVFLRDFHAQFRRLRILGKTDTEYYLDVRYVLLTLHYVGFRFCWDRYQSSTLTFAQIELSLRSATC